MFPYFRFTFSSHFILNLLIKWMLGNECLIPKDFCCHGKKVHSVSFHRSHNFVLTFFRRLTVTRHFGCSKVTNWSSTSFIKHHLINRTVLHKVYHSLIFHHRWLSRIRNGIFTFLGTPDAHCVNTSAVNKSCMRAAISSYRYIKNFLFVTAFPCIEGKEFKWFSDIPQEI